MIGAALNKLGFEPDWRSKGVYHSRRRRVEASTRWGGPHFELAALDDGYHTLIVGLCFLTLYIKIPKFIPSMEFMESGYGFSFTEDSLHLKWGNRTGVYWYPWSWDFYKRWEWVDGYHKDGSDGAWFEIPRRGRYNVIASKHEYDYTYTLKSGEKQHRKAIVSRDRMEWRWRWLKFSPWPRKVRTCIWAEFSDEVGERTGSWKGGVTACGENMLPGESPEQTLRRMEAIRKL